MLRNQINKKDDRQNSAKNSAFLLQQSATPNQAFIYKDVRKCNTNATPTYYELMQGYESIYKTLFYFIYYEPSGTN